MLPIPFNTGSLEYYEPKVGDIYGGGYIAYIYQSSDPQYDPYYTNFYVGAYNPSIYRGIIISTASISDSQFNDGGGTQPTASLNTYNGSTRTNAIYSAYTNPVLACSRVKSLSTGGYTDWFIPSAYEMQQIVSLTFSRTYMTQSYYWTSDLTAPSAVYGLATKSPEGGDIWTVGLGSIYQTLSVKAFRSFTIYT